MTWVSRVLGHSDSAMTLRVYAHVLPEESGGLDFFGGGGWAKGGAKFRPTHSPVAVSHTREASPGVLTIGSSRRSGFGIRQL